MRTAGSPVGPGRDVHRSLADHDWPVKRVVSYQPREGTHSIEEGVVIAAGGQQLLTLDALLWVGQAVRQCTLAPPRLLLEELEKVAFAFRLEPFQFRECDLGFVALVRRPS